MKTLLRNLQARLDRAALAQLREIAAKQADEIERLQAELEQTQRELGWAEDAATAWQDDFMRLQEQLAPGQAIGLHQDGRLSLVEVTA